MDLTELPETLDDKQIVEINGATVDLFENSKNSVYLLKEMQTFTKQIGNLILVCLNKKGELNFKFKFEFILYCL